MKKTWIKQKDFSDIIGTSTGYLCHGQKIEKNKLQRILDKEKGHIKVTYLNPKEKVLGFHEKNTNDYFFGKYYCENGQFRFVGEKISIKK